MKTMNAHEEEVEVASGPRRAYFKIHAAPGERFEKSITEATVTITYQDEKTAVFEVRPLRSRKSYCLTLEQVARMAMAKAAKGEVYSR